MADGAHEYDLQVKDLWALWDNSKSSPLFEAKKELSVQ